MSASRKESPSYSQAKRRNSLESQKSPAKLSAKSTDRNQKQKEVVRSLDRRESPPPRSPRANIDPDNIPASIALQTDDAVKSFRATPPSPRKEQKYHIDYRHEALSECFKMFDVDNSGHICTDELHTLADIRRKQQGDKFHPCGKAEAGWSAERNEALMEKLDKDADGKITESEFIRYFDDQWRHGLKNFNQADFDDTITGFHQAALEASLACDNLSDRDVATVIFKAADKNNNKRLSKSEVMDFLKAEENGKVKSKALRSALGGGSGVDELFDGLDAENAGEISLDEFKEFFAARALAMRKAAAGARGCRAACHPAYSPCVVS